MTLADDQPIGFAATAPIGLWNKQLGIDYPGVFKAIAKATAAWFTGNAAGAVDAAIEAVAAFRFEGGLPPGVLAWHLIRIALARAMAELTVEALSSLDQDPDDPERMVERLDAALDGAAIRIDPDFFARPGELPIVEAVQGPFREWLGGLGLNEAETGSVTRRLPAYFTFALHREWAGRPEYAPIEAEVRKADTPFAKADARERAWLRNAAYLRRLTQEPVFDETFGLDRIYIDLRAYWVETERQLGGRRGGPREMQGLRDEERYAVDLKAHLRLWLDEQDKDDCIRVVCGGPGSGKTSFAKMFAAELVETTDFGVLYVPLHEFDFTGDFRDALRRYVLEDARILPHDPLGDEEPRRLVVCFDGIDELAMEGKAGQEAAAEFCDHLDRRIGNVNRDGWRLKVILGGREVVVQANERVFRRPRQVLHVLPYYVPKRENARRPDMPCREDLDDPQGLLEADDRDLWWAKYGEVTGRGYRGLPKELRTGAPDEISAQPLFNYLVALSFERRKLPFGEGFNQNLLYRDLLEAVWERRWGRRQLPDVEKLEFAEFEGILKKIGLAVWHAGARGVSAATVADLCAKAGLNREMKAFEKGAEQGALSLMAAFYFKQTQRTGDRAYEFTHKSFGEYLAACALVNVVAEIEQDRAVRREQRRPWVEETTLVEWISLTGPAAIDRDLLPFIVRQVEVAKEDEGAEVVGSWRQTLADMFSHQLRHGLPKRGLDRPTFREMTRQARNAEEALLAAHFCCAEAVQEASPIDWPDTRALRDLITRLDQGQTEATGRRCLAWLDAEEVDGQRVTHQLFWADLVRANLVRANLGGAHLVQASLVGANLGGANLVEANLGGANLGGANLGGANLDGANLVRADSVEVRNLDHARNLDRVRSWHGARIERRWVERLGLDAGKLGLVVVGDVAAGEDA